jgi:hypothetical protein
MGLGLPCSGGQLTITDEVWRGGATLFVLISRRLSGLSRGLFVELYVVGQLLQDYRVWAQWITVKKGSVLSLLSGGTVW